VQITSQNILPSAKVLPVQKKAAGTYGARNLTSAKKASYTLIHIFSCRAIGSYQCKKLARNILPSAKVLPVQKKTSRDIWCKKSYQCKKASYTLILIFLSCKKVLPVHKTSHKYSSKCKRSYQCNKKKLAVHLDILRRARDLAKKVSYTLIHIFTVVQGVRAKNSRYNKTLNKKSH